MSLHWRQHLSPLVRSAARQLDTGGRIELAWQVTRAPQILYALRRIPCAVLGGDVFSARGAELIPTYDHWECRIARSESWGVYSRRSCGEAALYLSKLPRFRGLWFVPVCAQRPAATQLFHSYAS
jgi:hypothetical protein